MSFSSTVASCDLIPHGSIQPRRFPVLKREIDILLLRGDRNNKNITGISARAYDHRGAHFSCGEIAEGNRQENDFTF